MNKVPTYEERVSRMKVPGDEGREIRRAKQYMMRLKGSLKNAMLLEEKIIIQRDFDKAARVLRQLRLNIFDLEDMLQEVK